MNKIRKARQGEKCLLCGKKFRKGEVVIEDGDLGGVYCGKPCKS
jgi:hypothetical protein